MTNRREQLLDATLGVLGERGVHGVTHRAVDAAAGVPAGSTANYFPTREALFNAVVERFAARERANWEDLTASVWPTTPAELVEALARFARDMVGPHRILTISRYAILVEGALNESVRAQLANTGGQVNRFFANGMRAIGSADADRDMRIVANYVTGLVLHQLSRPDAAFDPVPDLTALIAALIPTGGTGRGRATRRRPAVVPAN